jgi:hypothetical protein
MKEHRKRIWIDPFQTGLLLRIAVYLLVYQLVVWAFFAFCEKINHDLASIGVEWPFLTSSVVRMVLALVILVPPLVLDSVRFAHRLVGPLYRFRKAIQAVAAGQPVALVQLRKGDLLVDFQDDLNRMLKTLEEKGLVLLQAPGAAAKAESKEAVSLSLASSSSD